MKTYSKHPFEEFIPKNATKLIIGTIPPARFCFDKNGKQGELELCDVNFYYGSRDNDFWPLNSKATGWEFTCDRNAVKSREDFLQSNSLGIMDMIEECERKKSSALDKDLTVKKRKDLGRILLENPSINTLIYTSEFVKNQVNIELSTYHHSLPNEVKKKKMCFGKPYDVTILYSPSPTALRGLGVGGDQIRLDQYKSVFKK